MSIVSYRHNVALGVTGRGMPTCLPAALEKISPDDQLPPQIYRDYRRFFNKTDFSDMRHANSEQRLMLGKIVENLGGLSLHDVELELVRKQRDFKEIVRWFLDASWRVAIDLNYNRTVGLLPATRGNKVMLVSNFVPQNLGGLVTLDEVFPHLAQPESRTLTRYNRYVEANVMALPVD